MFKQPSLKQVDPEPSNTEARLVEAAGEIFAEFGYRAATVRQICEKAGANVAAVNYHFGDKEGLYLAVLRSVPDAHAEKYPSRRGLNDNPTAEERLRAYIESLLHRVFDTGRPGWHTKIIAREMVEPTRALDSLEPTCASKQVELVSELAPDLPHVLGDPERVTQIISALVANAAKFTPKGGRIVVKAEADGEDMHFSVTDTGPGIPVENQPLLFGRRSHGMRPLGQGVGLALFVAKGVVEAHGGRIWADSRPGGATFHFTLPLATAAADGIAAAG